MLKGIGFVFPPWKRIKEPDEFSKLFVEMAGHLAEAARALGSCFAAGEDFPVLAKEVEAVEAKANETAERIHKRLDRTYIPPYDNRDIERLTSRLDDVVDDAKLAVTIAVAYRLHIGNNWTRNAKVALKLVSTLQDAAANLQSAIRTLPEFSNGTREAIREVRLMRSRAHNLLGEHLPELLGHPDETPSTGQLGWKDVYLALAKSVDNAREAADLLLSMQRAEGK